MPLVYIPAGIFWMGAASEDLDASSDEMPGHWVYLDAFWIDRTEVTNAMYALCVKAGVCKQPLELGSKTRPSYYGVQSYADYPVIHVTWGAAREYCRWVGGNLPTEAQWEKAARGWDDRRFPWGDAKPDGSRLNYNNQVGDTTVVGGYLDGTSGYDTLDMAGNVSEWVLDWYDEDYYRLAPVDNPTGPVDGEFRVIRGGSWFSPARSVRTSFRHWNLPDKGFDSSGFRCVRSP
jgi:formylglycine-generating enzyme required for sulfatase activity